MKKMFFIAMVMVIAIFVFADTGDLGGASVAVRDAWNDAEFLPAAAAFYPDEMVLKLDFDYGMNNTKFSNYYSYYNSTGMTADYKYDKADKVSFISPALKGRMRMGPLAFSLKFKSPIAGYKSTDDTDSDYDMTNPGTDWYKKNDEFSLKNGFPIDLGLKIGFAFSEMMGVGLNFNFNKQNYVQEDTYYREDETGVLDDDTYGSEINLSEIQFGLGAIFHKEKIVGGLSFQMSNLKADQRTTVDKWWNGSAIIDNWTDDKDMYPITNIKYNGFRINGILRYMSSENFTAGLAFVYDHFTPEVEMETKTYDPYAVIDEGSINIINIAPGVWYHTKKYEFASDIVCMLPSVKMDMLDYPLGPDNPAVVDSDMELKAFIWIFRAGGSAQLTDKLKLSFGYQRMNVSGTVTSKDYDNTGDPFVNYEDETKMSNLMGISNNAFSFKMNYSLSEDMSIVYRLNVGTYLDENDPEFIKDLLPYVGSMGSTIGNIDVSRTMTHKVAFIYYFK